MEPNESVLNNRQGRRQGKVVIERQPTDKKRTRWSTFLNLRDYLLKKARELATLCGVDVTLIMFSSQGELSEYSSNTNAHILHQYLVTKQEQGHTMHPKLVALYNRLVHFEALGHEANQNKNDLELRRLRIDPRLRKFTVDELQIMSERNLLNKLKETLQNNQRAVLEFYGKRREADVLDTLISKWKVEGNFQVHPEDFAQNYEPAARVPRETYNHRRPLTRYVNEAATPLTMHEQQDPQWVIATSLGPPGFVANQGQGLEFPHQVHTRHHEAYNMPQQSVMQQDPQWAIATALGPPGFFANQGQRHEFPHQVHTRHHEAYNMPQQSVMQQDPQWAIATALGPPGFVANQGQRHEFPHQVHTRHHEAYNMPQQSVMQQDPQWAIATALGPPGFVANQGQRQKFPHQVHTRHHEAYNMPQQSVMQQDPQWAIATALGPPGFVANQGQRQKFPHQVHTRHHEAYNMPQQSVMQQARESELLLATMERERELLGVQNHHEVMVSPPDQAQGNNHWGEQDINDILEFMGDQDINDIVDFILEQSNHQQEDLS